MACTVTLWCYVLVCAVVCFDPPTESDSCTTQLEALQKLLVEVQGVVNYGSFNTTGDHHPRGHLTGTPVPCLLTAMHVVLGIGCPPHCSCALPTARVACPACRC